MVGVNLQLDIEHLLFEIIWALQNIIEGSGGTVGRLREVGLREGDTRKNREWIVHPGRRAILFAVQITVTVQEKLLATTERRQGRMGICSNTTVLFAMGMMRSAEKEMTAVGEGPKWGFFVNSSSLSAPLFWLLATNVCTPG
ncbi:uncharacterized protein LOC109842439 [Asparagus officinalis]|uniref:uncharacterized protein LOC109842439 n=1 Tax=Asparagus officinalis TaxID=4686 RepID=UPI00098E5959|nr:uncharacterized protein LOC109842439 [Asparagus officinalis]